MQSWERVRMLNRYFAGTWMPRIQLDLIPALRCGAHFSIVSNAPLQTIDHYLQGGRVLQRFWLTATSLGLQFQPEMTPLIFSRYAAASMNFTQNAAATRTAGKLTSNLIKIVGQGEVGRSVFMGRVGVGKVPIARSVRLSIDELLFNNKRLA